MDTIIERSAIASLAAPPQDPMIASYIRVHGDAHSCEALIFCALLVQYPMLEMPTDRVILLSTHFHLSTLRSSRFLSTFTARPSAPVYAPMIEN